MGLLLSFSLIEFDDAEINVGITPYGADGEKDLKHRCNRRVSPH